MATRTDRVSVRLEAEELTMLQELAEAMGASTSDALRAMIRETYGRKGGRGARKPTKPTKKGTKR